MELRALKYLVSLFECGSFTAAARAHHITQPAISIQLRKLQEELGVVLFEVRGRVTTFTSAGRIVLTYAMNFVNLERELFREIEDLSGLRKGSVALGTIDAASIYVLPGVFATFQRLYPGIDVHLEIASTAVLCKGLLSGRLDLVVGTVPVDGDVDFDLFPVFEEKLVLIGPPGHPLTRSRTVSGAALSRYPFISFHKESITRHIVERTLLRKGITLQIKMEMDSPEAIKKLVASGLGLSVLPLQIVRDEIENGSVSLIRIRGTTFERKLGLFVRKGSYLPATVRAFLGVMSEELGIALPERLTSRRS